MKNLMITTCVLLLSISLCTAQEKKDPTEKKEKIHLSIKDGASPDVYVDGKKFDFSIDLLNKDKIATFKIIKGEEALKKYNAKNGVILIKTTEDLVELDKTKVKVRAGDPSKKTIIIINGKPAKKADLEKINPKRIENIHVVKGEKAEVEYNAPNGAVIVTTKKGNKKKPKNP